MSDSDVRFIEEASRRLPAVAERGRAEEAAFVAFAAGLGATTPAAAEALAQRLGIPGVEQIRERTRQEHQKLASEVKRTDERVREQARLGTRNDRGVADGERAYAFAAKVKPLLDAGRGPGEILDVVRNDRAAIAALRDAAEPAMLADGADRGSIRLDDLYRAIDDAEIALLEPAVREGRLTDRRRGAAVEAFEASAKYVLEGRGSPGDQIALAFAHASALGVPAHLPGRQDWTRMVDSIDPEAAAKRALNSLDPATRGDIDTSGRQVGWRSSDPVELAGPEAVRRMTR